MCSKVLIFSLLDIIIMSSFLLKVKYLGFDQNHISHNLFDPKGLCCKKKDLSQKG